MPNVVLKLLRNSSNGLGLFITPILITMYGSMALPYFLFRVDRFDTSGDASLPFAVCGMLTVVAALLAVSLAFAFSFAGITWYVTLPIVHYATLFTVCAVNKTGIWP